MGLLLDYQTNQMEADPTAEESEGGDRVILRIVMRMWNLMIFMLVGFSVKFMAEHNHPLSAITSKWRMHRTHSTVHRSYVIQRLVRNLNSEGIRPSNIVRVCNTAGC